jgi:conjugative transposon TraM protein
MNNRSAQFLRKRKFYLVLPLLALPFVTLAFWAMGGGKEKNEEVKSAAGLNLQLPDAKLKDEKNFDKLSFYNLAEKDSLKNEEALKNDPNYKPDTGMNVLQMVTTNNSGFTPENNKLITSPFGNNGIDANEQKIYKKINELNRQINTPNEVKSSLQNNSGQQNNNVNEQFSNQVDKLQNMMQVMNDKPEKDPEMEQIGGMLDKILDIQHPERMNNKIKEKSIKNKQQVFSVQGSVKNDNISLMQSGKKSIDTIKKKSAHNSFFDLNNSLVDEVSEDHAIEAVIHETQTVVSGSTVKLRLTNDIYSNGILIPKGNFIYGTASLENERLAVAINAIRYQNNLLPVSLTVYDLDGIAGIHIPGAISRDVAKQSADQGLQNIDITTLDPSLAALAANTGIQAAKSLLSKKVKLIKVTLKAGYKVLLKDNNKNNN